MPHTIAKPRWRRRKNARPEEIINAALEVFADRGFAATKLEDVARRAGVTKGTIYLYFENKEALFKALIRQTIVPVIAQGEELAKSFTGSARDLFERLVREYWRLVGETSLVGIPKLMMSPLMHAVIARKAFSACMPEGFDVAKYLDTHIDLYLHGISK